MGLSPARWLIDKSALYRINRPEVAEIVREQLAAGRVGVSIATELEMGYSARSTSDYWETRQKLIDHLLPVTTRYQAEARAREVQRMLVERGQHRSAGVADLLVAATAEIEGLTIWHYDADFDMIAAVTGQASAWVVPRGTMD
ncbi:MAG: PIN domain nuclease [Actinomycetota bacterium]|nr:PIN domain nuclease [Actinomycetota bacterium]